MAGRLAAGVARSSAIAAGAAAWRVHYDILNGVSGASSESPSYDRPADRSAHNYCAANDNGRSGSHNYSPNNCSA